jgi:hypothetical protein
MTDISPEFLERLEEPDGDLCVLLNRVPYDRQRVIEIALAEARSTADRLDAALRGMLWEAKVKDYLTGEATDDPARANTAHVFKWRLRAMELYNAWYAEAFPDPKPRKRAATTAR